MPVDGDVVLKAGLDTTDISKKMDSMQKTISRGLKNIIRVGFGVRSVFMLIRKLRTALFAGFGDLAQVYEPFNSAMSQIMTSLRLLRNTFASAFAPIIETVAPALSTFINMIAEAVSKIGQFIAALTGKEYVQAGTAYIDYAKSLDKSSKSSSNATKQTKKQTEAQKKLNREITHFDDLVILHEKHENENTTPTTTTTTPTSTFKPVAIGDAITQFTKDFKSAWARGDFTDLGNQVGEKLKTMLEHLPWEKIQAGTRKVANNIATFLNGFLETPGLFTEIGNTVGEAVNTALAGRSTFAWNFHWGSLGTAISDAVKAALGTINWDDAYSAAEGFGKGYAEYLNNLITPETFGLLGTTLANVLNTAFKFLAKFGTTFDWTNFGVSLATGLNKFLENLNIDDFKRGVHAFVYGIRDSIIAFLDETDWYKFGTTLRDIIEAIPWTTILTSFGEIFWRIINVVIDAARGFFNTETVGGPVAEAFDTLKTTLQGIADDIDFDAIKDGFKRIIDAIKPAVQGIFEGFVWFFERLHEMGQNFLKSLGPSLQTIADVLENVDPQILEGIGKAIGAIGTALIVVNLGKGALGVIGGLFGPLKNLASGAAEAAGAIGTGTAAVGGTGLVGSLFMLASAAGAFLWALEEGGMTTATEDLDSHMGALKPTIDATKDSLSNIAQEFGLTSEQVEKISELLADNSTKTDLTADSYKELDQYLANSGVDVEKFRQGIAGVVKEADNSGKVYALSSYIDAVGVSSEDANTHVTGFSGAFDAFDSLSIATQIKMLLLSTAIKNLGEAGVLSDGQVSNLQTTLDEYNANPTEQALGNIKTAFENTGIKADEFNASLAQSMAELPRETRNKISDAVKEISSAGDNFYKESKEDAKQAGEGLEKGAKEAEDGVKDAFNNIAMVGLGGLDTGFDSHSPSKETYKRGTWAGQGLRNGLNSMKSTLIQTAQTISTSITSKFGSYNLTLNSIGNSWMSNLQQGLNNYSTSLQYTAQSIGGNIYSAFNDQGWYTLGDNIGIGIYNGLVANSGWLSTLAWNTAVAMYNSACAALGISSPSKKFAWVGEMVTKGLGKGIVDNQEEAVDAVTDMTTAMTDEAEKTHLAVEFGSSVDNWIENLDTVLTEFSDTIINRFDNLINTLAQLSSLSVSIPAVAQGRVIPSSVVTTSSVDANSSEMRELLNSLASQQVGYDELRSLLIEMFTDYMRTDFYLGDEQIARHANNGNLLLNRRYSIMKS